MGRKIKTSKFSVKFVYALCVCVGRGSVGPSGTFCDLTENSVYHPVRHSCQEDHLEFVHICVNDEKAQVAILL